MRHGDYVRKIIEERGITQQGFADMLIHAKSGKQGVSRTYAIALLSMEKIPIKRIQEINKLFNINIELDSKEIDIVNEQPRDDVSQTSHQIALLKKDVEVLKAKIEGLENTNRIKDELLNVYRSKKLKIDNN